MSQEFFKFQQFMLVVEANGALLISEYKDDPELEISWDGGLEEIWEAANGAKESSIQLLSRYYYYQQMISGKGNDDTLTALDSHLYRLEDALNSIVEHEFFESTEVPEGGGTYADKLEELVLNNELREKFQTNSRKLYLEKFTESNIVENFSRVFHGVLKK